MMWHVSEIEKGLLPLLLNGCECQLLANRLGRSQLSSLSKRVAAVDIEYALHLPTLRYFPCSIFPCNRGFDKRLVTPPNLSDMADKESRLLSYRNPSTLEGRLPGICFLRSSIGLAFGT